jgi:hypothetical protein
MPADESSQELESLDQVIEADVEVRKKELEASFDEENALKNLPAGPQASETEVAAKEKPAEQKPTEKEALPDGKTDERYAGLQRTMSRKDQEIADLKAKLAITEQGEQRKAKLKETDGLFEKFLVDRALVTMKQIGEVAEDDPAYDTKVATIRAKELSDTRRWERDHPEVFGSFADKKEVQAAPPVETPAAEVVPPVVDAEEKEGLVSFCEKTLVAAGYEANDPVFGFFASRAPVKDEKGGSELTFEQQVEWALGKTKDHYASVKQKFSVEAGVKRQAQNMPLGKGTVAIPMKNQDDAKPVTIDDALQEVRRERTL